MRTDSELPDAETRIGLKYVMRQGLAGHAMGTLAGGIFMVKIALELGASLFVIGLYAMHRLTSVVEESQQPSSAVVQSLLLEVKRPLLSFTTVGGFTDLIYLPLGVIGRERRRRTRNEGERGGGDSQR